MEDPTMEPDTKNFEGKITELKKLMVGLGNVDSLEELIRIIVQPGWTTPAENIFAVAIVDSMILQAQELMALEKQLLAGSRLVGKVQT